MRLVLAAAVVTAIPSSAGSPALSHNQLWEIALALAPLVREQCDEAMSDEPAGPTYCDAQEATSPTAIAIAFGLAQQAGVDLQPLRGTVYAALSSAEQ